MLFRSIIGAVKTALDSRKKKAGKPLDASEEEAVEEREEREASALAAEKALRAEAERELRK